MLANCQLTWLALGGGIIAVLILVFVTLAMCDHFSKRDDS